MSIRYFLNDHEMRKFEVSMFKLYGGAEGGVIRKGPAYICFPPKIRRCCTGGIPSFSSTFSLICETCKCQQSPRRADEQQMEAYLVIVLDVEFDLFARQGPYPTVKSAIFAMNVILLSKNDVA